MSILGKEFLNEDDNQPCVYFITFTGTFLRFKLFNNRGLCEVQIEFELAVAGQSIIFVRIIQSMIITKVAPCSVFSLCYINREVYKSSI